MKKKTLWLAFLLFVLTSCGSPSVKDDGRVITVSIPPFAYFVEAVAGDDFKVSIMLPPGADHHIWEPLPAQINALAGSEAFIINGQLGFEQAWMGRFREINPGYENSGSVTKYRSYWVGWYPDAQTMIITTMRDTSTEVLILITGCHLFQHMSWLKM